VPSRGAKTYDAHNMMMVCESRIEPSPERLSDGPRQTLCRNASGQAVLAAVLLAVGLLVSCSRHEDNSTTASGAAATNAPVAAAPTKAEFARLAGKWERPDGGYVVEIKSSDASGKLDVSYFNPEPINVARALAVQQDGVTKVFLELRDVNYPGCTYSLSYDPQSDQLQGQYFQAAMEETFDVVFTRLKGAGQP
jgi:uncharacterized protein (DUF2147 family)